MNFFKNRTVIGLLCIVLSLVICFAITPMFNRTISEKTEIVRVTKNIRIGDEITKDMVKPVEVGAYNLPESVVRNIDEVIGKYASADMAPGDYIIRSKVAEEPAAENAYLYNLNGEKQAISVSVKAFANGLSGKLISGDIVSIFTKKKIVMRAGETDKSVSFKDEKLFGLIRKFVAEIGYRGEIDIDIFDIGGEYYISEVNPRFGGGYPHAYECGCNHMRMILENLYGRENQKNIGIYEEGIYMMKYNEVSIKKLD